MFTAKPPKNGAFRQSDSALPQRPPQANSTHAYTNDLSAEIAAEDGLVVIGKGAHVLGSITSCSRLDVHGLLEADVDAECIVVHEGGSLKGAIQTSRADVLGELEGTVFVNEHLDVRSSGKVRGDLTYGSVSVAAGAKIVGAFNPRSVPLGPAHEMAIQPVKPEVNGAQARAVSNGRTERATPPIVVPQANSVRPGGRR